MLKVFRVFLEDLCTLTARSEFGIDLRSSHQADALFVRDM